MRGSREKKKVKSGTSATGWLIGWACVKLAPVRGETHAPRVQRGPARGPMAGGARRRLYVCRGLQTCWPIDCPEVDFGIFHHMSYWYN